MCFQNKTTEGETALPEGVSTTNTAATHSFRAVQSSCFSHFIRRSIIYDCCIVAALSVSLQSLSTDFWLWMCLTI